MARKALPKKQVELIRKKFRITRKKAEEFIRAIMMGFKIPCDDAVRLLLAIKALRKLR
jgi:hypothetical protein